MLDEHAEFLERALVEEDGNPFAGGQFAAGMLLGDAALAATLAGALAPGFELFENILHGGRLPAGKTRLKAGLSGESG
jgi:hypothetical protein